MTTKTLYISDLDGTLLNNHAELSESSRNLLNRLIHEKSLNFSIATARTPATVVRILNGLESHLPYIVMTGAAMLRNGIMTRQRFMRQEEAETISRLFHEAEITPFAYIIDNGKLEAYHVPRLTDYESRFVATRSGSPYKRFVFANTLPQHVTSHAMLFFASGKPACLFGVAEKIRKATPCNVNCYNDTYDPKMAFIEVMAENASKADAIKSLADEIGAGRIVVFGDSTNDLSMRSVADLFIAPANAAAAVREVADEIIGPNTDDSVVRRISRDFPG